LSPRRLSTVLKRLRQERGLTQEEVAKRAKVTRFYISQLETGLRKSPSLPVLKRLATALGVPVTALLE
jgi:XRE family transcriptional regulator, master regulator for biofilm formation